MSFFFAQAEKVAWAREAGADEVIVYTEQDFETEVMRLTSGKGVNVVYDSVAKTTFDKSLNYLGVRGVLARAGVPADRISAIPISFSTRRGDL